MDRHSALYLKNTSVALLMVVPWIVLSLASARSASSRPKNPPQVPSVEQPPIIALTEGEGYTFSAGSAELSPSFKNALDQSVSAAILDVAMRYQCDVVEVVGHTDGQPINGRSALDTATMLDSLSLPRSLAGSNADLGLMRAWAVRQHLRAIPELKSLKFRVFSGANLTLPSGEDADWSDRSDAADRRRIEIRLRRDVRTLRARAVQADAHR